MIFWNWWIILLEVCVSGFTCKDHKQTLEANSGFRHGVNSGSSVAAVSTSVLTEFSNEHSSKYECSGTISAQKYLINR